MQIDVWSDFACPWCALGLARLEVARAAFEHGDEVSVVHRSFQLDPHAPARRDVTMVEAVAKKYGLDASSVLAGHGRLTALGAEVGVVFDFDRVQLGNTFDAHRLAQAARGAPYEEAVLRGLFAAYFAEGRWLAGDAHAAAVRADEADAAAREVLGVPYFLFNGAWPVPGAQDVETMLIVLRRAWSRLGH